MKIGVVNWSDPRPQSAGKHGGSLPNDSRLRDHVLFETSGSTGAPKHVALAKSALEASAHAVNSHLEVDAKSCWGLALPPYHVGGFGVLVRSQLAACRLAQFTEKWQPQRFHAWLARERISHLALVPTQVFDLVAQDLTAPRELRALVVGGGHLDPAIGQRARDLGWPVLASFGMTEAASQVATQALSELSTAFRPAPIPVLPHWHVATDSIGRLRLAGPALFSGMLLGTGSQAIFQPRTIDWFETNDRVALTPHGLWPRGRIDPLIKILGELVDPHEIEAEIIAASGGSLIADSFVVVALPSDRREHVLVAVADASKTSPGRWHAAVSAYQATAPGFRRLEKFPRIADFPRSELGKPRRGEIAARFNPSGLKP